MGCRIQNFRRASPSVFLLWVPSGVVDYHGRHYFVSNFVVTKFPFVSIRHPLTTKPFIDILAFSIDFTDKLLSIIDCPRRGYVIGRQTGVVQVVLPLTETRYTFFLASRSHCIAPGRSKSNLPEKFIITNQKVRLPYLNLQSDIVGDFVFPGNNDGSFAQKVHQQIEAKLCMNAKKIRVERNVESWPRVEKPVV